MIEYHRELIAGEARTLAYRAAIERIVKPGDVVLDLGAGSGILSFFACAAGAAHVYAIEQTHMADVIALLARQLGFSDRLTVLHDLSTNVELPRRANVLVTETLGAAGFDEHILSSLLDAKRRLLHDDARIVPQRVLLEAVPVEYASAYDQEIAWFSEPRYGFDLSALRVFASNSMRFAHIEREVYLADPATVIDVDLQQLETAFASGRATYTATRSGTMHGIALWFRATLAEGVVIDNATAHRPSWSQTFLPLETPIAIEAGMPLEMAIETDDGNVWRWSGQAGDRGFDQTTLFAAPPCMARQAR